MPFCICCGSVPICRDSLTGRLYWAFIPPKEAEVGRELDAAFEKFLLKEGIRIENADFADVDVDTYFENSEGVAKSVQCNLDQFRQNVELAQNIA